MKKKKEYFKWIESIKKCLSISASEAREQINLETALTNAKVIFGKDGFAELMFHIEMYFMFHEELSREAMTNKIKKECDFYLQTAKYSWD